ncbi:amidohydrolase family protein [Spongiimicrobium salis]|uniref:hypothetical protein n=1 Tax=Spongiimicrobium salis TaxID=1667022 RepID=UPI00374CBD16
MPKKKIINVHTHVFTGNFVPPYLARTIVPWPFFYFIHTGWIIKQFKKYYAHKYRKEFARGETQEETDALWEALHEEKRRERKEVLRKYFISSRWYLRIPIQLLIFWVILSAAFYFIDLVKLLFGIEQDYFEIIDHLKDWLTAHYLHLKIHWILKVIWVILVLIFIRRGRKLLFILAKKLFPILKKIANPQLAEMLDRYYLMGRFSFYGTQRKVAQRALHQIPPGSSMVILPMDMEFMGAGTTKISSEMLKSKEKNLEKGWTEDDYKESFHYQMRELWDVVKNPDSTAPKEAYYPFLFIDPRRVERDGSAFFDYEVVNDKMVLRPCFVKTYMEDRQFSGFKIYPALGYYPFDKYLLPIWRYAAENNIPIMTHCVMGVIYYRGAKKKAWNFHPVFQTTYGKDEYGPMLLPQTKNKALQFNFTHPMNYLCLLEESFLKTVIKNTEDEHIKKLFGYSEADDTLQHNLSNLKVCLAHFGGEEEWIRYMEQDRETYSQRLMRNPKEAIRFMTNSDNEFSWFKISSLWEKGDWFSIICSMMIRYQNVYADLSYIISKPSIYPLLKYALEKGEDYETEHQAYSAETSPNKKAMHYSGKNKLRSRILFGTDFYVVRNHNSDKDLFIETKALLDEEDFDLIARENTANYLSKD